MSGELSHAWGEATRERRRADLSAQLMRDLSILSVTAPLLGAFGEDPATEALELTRRHAEQAAERARLLIEDARLRSVERLRDHMGKGGDGLVR